MIKTITVNEHVLENIVKIMGFQGYKEISRHIAGGTYSPVTASITFEGTNDLRNDVYILKNGFIYNIENPNGAVCKDVDEFYSKPISKEDSEVKVYSKKQENE